MYSYNSSKPCSQFKYTREPTFLCLVNGILSHMIIEGGHGQNATEDSLIVSIQQTADTGETCDAEDTGIAHEQSET